VRFKNRWLLVEFIHADRRPTPALSDKVVWGALKASVIANFGDWGWGAIGDRLVVKYYSPVTNICIIRTPRDHHRIAWGAVTLMTSLEGVRYIPRVIKVSGTIKKVQLAAIQHDHEEISRIRTSPKSASLTEEEATMYLASSLKEIKTLQD